MKTLVVGYGSIGKRHSSVLNNLGHDTAIVSRRDSKNPKQFRNITEAVKLFNPSYVVIASRTEEHYSNIEMLADAGFLGKLLIEKPLYRKGSKSPPKVFSSIKVAFNLRFHPALLRFREIVSERNVYAVNVYVGSYLPNWRPNTDYRQSYSAIYSQGGGVLRDLSHELDYLTWIFGPWKKVAAIGGHFSNLQIDSEDVFLLLLTTEKVKAISLNMNYIDTIPRREVIALTNDGTVSLDLIQNTIQVNDRIETFNVSRNTTYEAQHIHMIGGNNEILCDIEEGLANMCLIEAAENAARLGKWIQALNG